MKKCCDCRNTEENNELKVERHQPNNLGIQEITPDAFSGATRRKEIENAVKKDDLCAGFMNFVEEAVDGIVVNLMTDTTTEEYKPALLFLDPNLTFIELTLQEDGNALRFYLSQLVEVRKHPSPQDGYRLADLSVCLGFSKDDGVIHRFHFGFETPRQKDTFHSCMCLLKYQQDVFVDDD